MGAWRPVGLVRRVGGLAITATLILGCGSFLGETPPSVPAIPLEPSVECFGVPPDICRDTLRDARANAASGALVVAIRVQCTQPSCTRQNGSARVEVLYTNGGRETYETGWAGADPAPRPQQPPLAPPVEPTCTGLPVHRCDDFAISAMDGVPAGAVVRAIDVRCMPGPCTETMGSGTSVVTLEDGSTITSDWSYEEG